MTPTKILIGQAIIVMLIIVAALEAATQYVAGALGFDAALGAPWFEFAGTPVHYPWCMVTACVPICWPSLKSGGARMARCASPPRARRKPSPRYASWMKRRDDA
jgi:type IV secretory pathway TraG/TraD family ATPase VirD4